MIIKNDKLLLWGIMMVVPAILLKKALGRRDVGEEVTSKVKDSSGYRRARFSRRRNMTPLMYKGKMVGALREDVEIEDVEPGVVRKTPKGIKVQLLYGDEPVGFLLISEIEKI